MRGTERKVLLHSFPGYTENKLEARKAHQYHLIGMDVPEYP